MCFVDLHHALLNLHVMYYYIHIIILQYLSSVLYKCLLSATIRAAERAERPWGEDFMHEVCEILCT